LRVRNSKAWLDGSAEPVPVEAEGTGAAGMARVSVKKRARDLATNFHMDCFMDTL
jgi:hypothetical protein